MSDIVMPVRFPLDDDGFFRRKCPLCCKEFKVLLKKEELADLSQIESDSFMLDSREETSEVDDFEDLRTEYFCPYCGQKSPYDQWWTQEQVAYIYAIIKNIMAQLINKNFIRPLKRSLGKSSSGMISLRFEGKEIKQQEAWISPEINDMVIFDLPCCERKIKIGEGWQNTTYCFFCGFPYKKK